LLWPAVFLDCLLRSLSCDPAVHSGDVVVVTPLLDRLMHHVHLVKFEGKIWRLKDSGARLASHHDDA